MLASALLILGAGMTRAHAQIELPLGNAPFLTAFGDGVQIYKSGANGGGGYQWNFVAPSANLFTDATETVLLGTHYVGPTWQLQADGSAVVGMKIAQAASPNPNSIPELLLKAISHSGIGLFDDVTYVERLNTLGGIAPATAPTGLNQEADVHYTATYVFAATTPEPGPVALLAGGAVVLLGVAWRRRHRSVKAG